jgi:O-antigen/teichoic acid export membrane protein
MSRRLSHDIMGVFGSRSLVAVLGTVTGIVLARTLGPHDRGILGLFLLLPSTLMTLTKFGITQANVYCVRREGAPVEQVAANSLALSVGLGLGIGVIVWACKDTLLATVMPGVPVWALLLALWRLPLLLIDNFFNGVLQSIGNFAVYNKRTILGAALLLVMTVVLALGSRLDLDNAIVIYTISTMVVVASLLIQTRRMIPFGLRPDRGILRRQVRFGMLSYVQILCMHLLFRADCYMVAYFLGPRQFAFYSLALHFTEIIMEIPEAVGWVLYPRLASLQHEEVHRLTAQACRRTVLLTGLGGLAVVVAGPFMVRLWYGQDYAPAGKPLTFIVVGMLMMAVFTILTRDFTSRNNQAVNIRAGGVALIVNVVLNVFLIPAMGIEGAALATAIAYSLAACLVMIAYRRESGIALSAVLIPRIEDVQSVWEVLWQAARRRWSRPAAAAAPQPTAVTAAPTSPPKPLLRLPSAASDIRGAIADASFAFQCDAPDLMRHARAHLAPLVGAAVSTPTITASVRWHDGQPPRQPVVDARELAGMERVDRDVYANGERLCWFRVDDLRDLFLRFTWRDERLAVHGDFYYRLGNRWVSDRIRRAVQWRRRHALRQRRFPTLLSYMVYYPSWWWLEQTRDLHPIHAAGVVTDAGAVLLAGASGVGKSTLAVALAHTPGVRLLSDSFVLHNGLDVHAVPEPVLLDRWSCQWLGKSAGELQPIDGHFGLHRHGYQLPPHRRAAGGRAVLLLFPRRAPEPYVRRISAEQACQRLSAAGLIINDLRRYWAFAAVMEQMVPGGLVARREAQIARLVTGVACYELGVAANGTSRAVADAIMQLVDDKQLRVASARP